MVTLKKVSEGPIVVQMFHSELVEQQTDISDSAARLLQDEEPGNQQETDTRTKRQQLLQPELKLQFIISMKYGRGGIFYQRAEKCKTLNVCSPRANVKQRSTHEVFQAINNKSLSYSHHERLQQLRNNK